MINTMIRKRHIRLVTKMLQTQKPSEKFEQIWFRKKHSISTSILLSGVEIRPVTSHKICFPDLQCFPAFKFPFIPNQAGKVFGTLKGGGRGGQ